MFKDAASVEAATKAAKATDSEAWYALVADICFQFRDNPSWIDLVRLYWRAVALQLFGSIDDMSEANKEYCECLFSLLLIAWQLPSADTNQVPLMPVPVELRADVLNSNFELHVCLISIVLIYFIFIFYFILFFLL